MKKMRLALIIATGVSLAPAAFAERSPASTPLGVTKSLSNQNAVTCSYAKQNKYLPGDSRIQAAPVRTQTAKK
jgi:hypothetical protein